MEISRTDLRRSLNELMQLNKNNISSYFKICKSSSQVNDKLWKLKNILLV